MLAATAAEPDGSTETLAMKAATLFDSKITYHSTEAELVAEVPSKLGGSTPLVVMVDAATSRVKVNAELLELATRLHAMSSSNKVRIIVCVNRRFDLMAKVQRGELRRGPKSCVARG